MHTWYEVVRVPAGRGGRVVTVSGTDFDTAYYFGNQEPRIPPQTLESPFALPMDRGHDWKVVGPKKLRVSYSDPDAYWILLVWLGQDAICSQCGANLGNTPQLRFCPHCGARLKTGKTFELNVADSVLYGKYKNKPGKITGFGQDPKSGDPTVTIEPVPKGRKQDKEIKLFKIREDKKAGLLKPPLKMTKEVAEWAVQAFCEHHLAIFDRYPATDDNARRIEQEARKYAHQGRNWGGGIRQFITDLSDWPYTRHIPPNQLQDTLKGDIRKGTYDLSVLTVLVRTKVGMTEPGGGMSPKGTEMLFVIPEMVRLDFVPGQVVRQPKWRPLSDFKKALEKCRSTIRHEMQHFAQSLLEQVTGSESAGLPGGPAGYRSHGGYTPGRVDYQQYQLDDFEYFPTLTDSAKDFLQQHSRGYRPGDIRQWVNTQSWFRTLKRHAPQRWQQAVKDFYLYVDKARKTAALNPQCRYEYARPGEKCPVPDWVLQRLKTEHLGAVGAWQVWAVDGPTVRDVLDIDFTQGGNPAVYGYVPDNEIWLEDKASAKDLACTLFHEVEEARLMQTLGLPYEEAHKRASLLEERLRQRLGRITRDQVVTTIPAHFPLEKTAGGFRVLYHIGKAPPRPYPHRTYEVNPFVRVMEEWERPWLQEPVETGVFLTPNPLAIGHHHGRGKGNVYAYRVPEWVIAKAGGIHRYDHGTEILIPAELWPEVKFLGKSLDPGKFQRLLQENLPRRVVPTTDWVSDSWKKLLEEALREKNAAVVKQANAALAKEYQDTLAKLRVQVAYNKSRSLENTSSLWMEWYMFYKAGKAWSAYVLDRLALPPKAAKPVEMAVRLFSKNYPRGKAPTSIIKWFESNEKRLELLNQARLWPERTEDSGVIKLGPFTVHDTIQANPKLLKNAEMIVDKAVRAGRTVPLPGFASMFYGELYLVGQIARKSWAAWYTPTKDSIYLRPGIRGVSVEDSARHLVHEIAHRYWAKKLDSATKTAWKTHHTMMLVDRPDVHLPQVGEVLPTIVNRKRVQVQSYQAGKATLVEVGTEEPVGVVSTDRLWDWIQEANHMGQFPSLYAARGGAEEHFCESVSLLAFGDLTGSNLDAFNRVVLGVVDTHTVKVARK